MIRRIGAPLLFSLLAVSASPAQARRFELNDFGREVGWSNPRLSPDGRSIAAVVGRVNYAENRFERSVILVDVASGISRNLTPGRRNAGSVEWSPAGDALAFLDRDGDKPPQVFVLPIAGGEARRITDAKKGVSSFGWRPDGKAFAYLTEDEPVEVTGPHREHIVAFRRSAGRDQVVVAAARHFARMTDSGTRWPAANWQAALKLDQRYRTGLRDALGRDGAECSSLDISHLFAALPVAVLRNR